MTFPSVRSGHASTSFATAGTTRGVVMPSTVESGDMLLVLLAISSEAFRTITPPAGWTSRKKYTYGFYGTMECFTKDTVAGTEDGTTVNFTLDVAATGSAISLAIDDAQGELVFSDLVVESFTATPNPPSLTSGFGAVDTLWLAWATGRDDNASVSGFPASYTHFTRSALTGHASQNITSALAGRQLNAASADPGTFTLSEAEYCGSATIAVRPVAGTIVESHTPSGGLVFGGSAEVTLPTEASDGGGVDTNIRILVDTDNDGDFSEAIEDWTTDVIDARVITGRDFPSQLGGRAVPGRLRVVLRNDSGKYDYFRSSSPLNTGANNLRSGKMVRAQVDEAENTDPVLIFGDQMGNVGEMGSTEIGGLPWLDSFGGNFTRTGDGQAEADADAVTTVDAGVVDGYFQVRLRKIDPPNAAGLVYRWVDDDNWGGVLLDHANQALRHQHVVGGVPTEINATTCEFRDVMTLGAYVNGADIQIYLEGVLLIDAVGDAYEGGASGTEWGLYSDWEAHRSPLFEEAFLWDRLWVPQPGVILTGDMSSITPIATEGGTSKRVIMEAEGQLARMAATIRPPASVGTSSQYPGITAGIGIGATLAELGMIHPPPAGGIEGGDIALGPVAIEDQTALEVARRFEATELGYISELPEGPVMFHGREHRDAPVVAAVFSDTGVGYSIETLELMDWLREIVNRAQAKLAPGLPRLVAMHPTTGGAAATVNQDVNVLMPDSPADDIEVGDLLLVGITSSIHEPGTSWLRPTGWEQLSGQGDAEGMVRWYGKKAELGDFATTVQFYADDPDSGGSYIARLFVIRNWLGDVQSAVQIATATQLYDVAQSATGPNAVLVSNWPRVPCLLIAYRSGMVSLDNTATVVSFTPNQDEPPGYTGSVSTKNEGVGENTFDVASQIAYRERVLDIEAPGAWGGTFSEFDFVEEGVVAIRGFPGTGIGADPNDPTVTQEHRESQREHRVVRTNPTIADLLHNYSDAVTYTNLILSRHANDRPLLRLTFHANKSAGHRTQAYQRRVGDLIRVISTTDDIDGEFFIEHIAHAWNEGDRRWLVTWELSLATAPTDATVPAAITDLEAVGGDDQVLLTWTEPYDGGDDIVSYDIHRSTTSATLGFTELDGDIDPASSYIDTTATNGTQYWYRVRATNGVGDANWSNVVTATPAGPPAGSAISIVGTSQTDYSVTGATTRQITLPSGIAADDLIVIWSSTQDSASPGAPTAPGFTQRWSEGHASSFRPLLTCLYKKAVGTESGTTVTLTWGTSLDNALVCVVFRGVDTTTPFDVAFTGPTNGTNNPDPASITPVTNGAWVLVAVGANRPGGLPTPTISTGYSTATTQVPDERGMIITYKALNPAAADNPAAWTWATVDHHTTVTDALRPAIAGGGGPPTGGTPEPTIPTFSSTITITTAQNAKTIIEAASAGTHFTLASGTHTSVNGVLLKSNMHVRLATGCILEGAGKGYAFRPADQSVTNVSIGGDPGGARPIIRNYGNGTSSQEYGAIMGRTDDALAGQFLYRDVDDWFIYHLDMEKNSSNAIKLGSNWTVYDCEIHGHTVTGINGDRIVGGLLWGCEFYYNALSPATGASSNGANTKLTWINADVGRTSITAIDRAKAPFVISNCTYEALDRDGGPGDCNIGAWFDLDCQNCLVEFCTFDDHPSTSMFAEGCNNVRFDQNIVRNSDGYGPTFNGNFANAAICFGESTNCTASGNTLIGCNFALMNRMSNRTSDWYNSNNGSFVNYSWPSGPRYWILATQAVPAVSGQSNMWTGRNYFTDNELISCGRVVINEGTNGGGQTTHGSTPVSGADRIDFQGNDYSGSSGILFYNRSLTGINLASWQSLGYDT